MRCAVFDCCNSNNNKASECSFFKFPTDVKLQKKWINFCRRPVNPKTATICMDHFDDDAFENKVKYKMGFTKKRLLKRGVVPTIHEDELDEERCQRQEKRNNKKIVVSLLEESNNSMDVSKDYDENEEAEIDDVEEHDEDKQTATERQKGIAALISAYESLPVLWDSSHKDYTDKPQRKLAFLKLLDVYRKIEPTATTSDVKTKIHSVRGNYRRELRKINASRKLGNSEEECYRPKSWYYYALQFLQKLEAPQASMSDNDEEEVAHKSTPKQTATAAAATPSPTSSVSSEAQLESKRMRLPPMYKNARTTHLIERQNKLLQQLSKYLERTQQRPQAPQDPAIAKVWGELLVTLVPQQRIFAEKAINDIIFEAGLGNLHRYSIQIKINETANGIIDESRYLHSVDEDDDDTIIHDPVYTD